MVRCWQLETYRGAAQQVDGVPVVGEVCLDFPDGPIVLCQFSLSHDCLIQYCAPTQPVDTRGTRVPARTHLRSMSAGSLRVRLCDDGKTYAGHRRLYRIQLLTKPTKSLS